MHLTVSYYRYNKNFWQIWKKKVPQFDFVFLSVRYYYAVSCCLHNATKFRFFIHKTELNNTQRRSRQLKCSQHIRLISSPMSTMHRYKTSRNETKFRLLFQSYIWGYTYSLFKPTLNFVLLDDKCWLDCDMLLWMNQMRSPVMTL